MLSQTTDRGARRDGDAKHVAVFVGMYLIVLVVATLGRQALALWMSPAPPGLLIPVTRMQAVELGTDDRSVRESAVLMRGIAREAGAEEIVRGLDDRQLEHQFRMIQSYGYDIEHTHRNAGGILRVFGFVILAAFSVRAGYRVRDAFFGMLFTLVGAYVAPKIAWRATSPRDYWSEGASPSAIPAGWRAPAEGMLLGLGVIAVPVLFALYWPTPDWWVHF